MSSFIIFIRKNKGRYDIDVIKKNQHEKLNRKKGW